MSAVDRTDGPDTALADAVPGWEGTVGPWPGQYGRPHVYARDVTSGAGNCVCGRDDTHRLHVPVPASPRGGWRADKSGEDRAAVTWIAAPVVAAELRRLAPTMGALDERILRERADELDGGAS